MNEASPCRVPPFVGRVARALICGYTPTSRANPPHTRNDRNALSGMLYTDLPTSAHGQFEFKELRGELTHKVTHN